MSLCNTGVFAQTRGFSNPLTGRENNPYSKYGIGEFANGNNAVLRGMGNITSAYEHPFSINTDNPASYASLQRTTFEVGGGASTRTISGAGLNYRTGTATLSYLSLGMPVGKKAGICFGFKPYTHTYHRLVDTISATTIPVSPLDSVIREYQGDGALSYAFFGAGGKYKGFSFGFNFGYLFGTLRNTTAAVPIDTATVNRAFVSEFTRYTRIGGVQWKVGASYTHKIDSSLTLRFGGTFGMKQTVREHLSAYQISSFSFGDTIVRDTSGNSGEQHGKMELPMTYSLGVILSRNDKWSVGIDYVGTQWSGFKSNPDTFITSGVGSSSYRLSLGGEYTPDANNIRSYFSRMTYRLGFYYGTDYLTLQNTALPCYGVTVGTSLPFRRSLSRLHAAVDVGRLGTTTNNLMQQTYVRFTLGISLNDKWFIPRKYD